MEDLLPAGYDNAGHDDAGITIGASQGTPTNICQLIGELDEAAHSSANPKVEYEAAFQNKLVEQRLGVASSLYVALRAKHPQTAAHCLRVSLGCSAWAVQLQLSEQERDELEIAALLHDVGKIGVADHVIAKPSRLDGDELLAMETSRVHTRNILKAMGASQSILDVIHYSSAWYDGRRHGFDKAHNQLPLGARIISIVDAFDSMTTDHVYRRALSRERATRELYESAGTQFDPDLVQHFCLSLTKDRLDLSSALSQRWLQSLNSSNANSMWKAGDVEPNPEIPINKLFHQRLLDSMQDGVIFVDKRLKILLWNHAAERLTGIASSSVAGRSWLPSLVGMSNLDGTAVDDCECPVAHAVIANLQSFRRFMVAGRSGQMVLVDAQLVPILYRDGVNHGVAILLRDASRQATLEERVQSLHEQATRDPLTQLANRAEFDRVHQQFVQKHLTSQVPCSLIICDIDHFKRVNDTYGHQAGDEALISFAHSLHSFCRPDDLVARYGGEEFAILCADCDNATAAGRAEEIRAILASTPQSAVQGQALTASFGVTEIQAGDTPETMLRRADRALYQAKDGGRNRVVQLGSGFEPDKSSTGRKWFTWFKEQRAEQVLSRDLVTSVPLNVAAEKLRGFIADQNAAIHSVEENRVVLRIEAQDLPMVRRSADRPVPFFIELQLNERMLEQDSRTGGQTARTVIHVTIRPRRQRDRRRKDVVERARNLLSSVKSYFMADDLTDLKLSVESREPVNLFESLKTTFTPWLGK